MRESRTRISEPEAKKPDQLDISPENKEIENLEDSEASVKHDQRDPQLLTAEDRLREVDLLAREREKAQARQEEEHEKQQAVLFKRLPKNSFRKQISNE